MGIIFLIATNAGNAGALLTVLIFIIGVLLKVKATLDINNIAFERERKAFSLTGYIYLVLYWIWSSGLATEKCLSAYHTIYKVCTFWGCAWMIFAFLIIFVIVIMALKDRKNDIAFVARFRAPCFVNAGIYIFLAFLFRGL